jgi:hypothetical protein
VAGFRKLFGLGESPDGLAAELQRLQQNVDDATRKSRESAIVDSVTVKGVSIGGTAASPALKSITHKLGRVPRGFKVVRHHKGDAFTHAGDIFTATRIQFTTSSSCSVDILVW